MKFLKIYEEFVHRTEHEISPSDELLTDVETTEKIKEKEEGEKEEEKAVKRLAAGFLSNTPINKE